MLSSKKIITLLVVAHSFFSLATIPTKCLEIESILVDACNATGGRENDNEMVRFRVGPSPISVSSITIDWPNYTFQGMEPAFSTNATAAVNAINATIQKCGRLIQPPGGVIPAGASVILFGSYDVDPLSNSFTNLTDTLYAVFQKPQPTINSGGQFANYDITSGVRTFILGTGSLSSCSDTVKYNRNKLTKTDGQVGGADGAGVDYTWGGVATYINRGCQATYTPVTANAGSDITVCSSTTINLSGSATGNYSKVFWTGGTGVIANTSALITTYTPAIGETGVVNLFLGVVTTCKDTVYDTLKVTINTGGAALSITPSGSTTICSGGSVALVASGGSTYTWSTGSNSATITATTAGTYSVTSNGGCGVSTKSITVSVVTTPTVTIAGTTTICSGQSTTLTASGTGNYSWSTGATSANINITNAGTYTVTVSGTCGSATKTVSVSISNVDAVFTSNATEGIAPLDVTFTNNSTGAGNNYVWDFGNSSTSTLTNPTTTYTAPGTYNVNLTATNANDCSDTHTLQIIVSEGATSLIIPNVFTPNGDNKNDLFTITQTGMKELEGAIFDRWGTEVTKLNLANTSWDGKKSGGATAVDGTYFYVVKAQDVNGKSYSKSGFVSLLR